MDVNVAGSVDEWLETLKDGETLGELLEPSTDEQVERGYGHTLREICQQPVTWPETGATVIARRSDLARSLEGVQALVLTGSGSSLYAAECAAPSLQRTLGRPASPVLAGRILTHPEICLPPKGPFLLVSIARSGNSPESRAAVDWLLRARPDARHLVVTCNSGGALATAYQDVESLTSLVLDEKTNDRSLAMTSSFTNLVLASALLGAMGDEDAVRSRCAAVSGAAARILKESVDSLAELGGADRPSVVYLGSGCRLGAAHEAALKMLEMTAGNVWTLAESSLGLRHGPMSALRKDTLVVAFLSADPVVRAYETDLLRELDRKGLGQARVVVGVNVPADLQREGQLVVECGPEPILDDDMAVVDALVGQLLAFFRCRGAGFRPDSPSEDGVITRVVSSFQIHSRDTAGGEAVADR